jgi:molybdopterin/thiamine biosynthesis adenylyltransferase
MDKDRYNRQIILPEIGEKGQQKGLNAKGNFTSPKYLLSTF